MTDNCIEISKEILKTLSIQTISDMRVKLSKEDINLIQNLAEKEFKTNKNFLSNEELFQLNQLCLRFSVTSFEEVIRKILFYNLLKLKLSNKYLIHIKIFSKIRIAKTLMTRKLLLQTAYNMPEIFNQFCQRWEYLHEFEDMKKELALLINKIRTNNEIQNTFIEIKLIIDEIDLYFETIFNSAFKIEDFEKTYSNKISFFLKKQVMRYLYLINNVLCDALPSSTRREDTQQERHLLNFLLYEGDETDYMKKYNIPLCNFNDLLARIIYNHRENKQQNMLNAYYIFSKIEDSYKNI